MATRSTALAIALPLLTAGAPCFAESARPGGEVIVDRIVATVGGAGETGRDIRIVTAYELEIEARLVLSERAHSLSGVANRPLTRRFLDSVLEMVIDHLLVVGEASRLEVAAVSEEDITSERRSIEERLGGPGTLESFRSLTGAPEGLVAEILRRRALVSAFIQRNLQISARVTDADIAEAYRQGDHPFGDRPLEEIRASLDAFLTARRQRERLAAWLEETRQRSRIRFISP